MLVYGKREICYRHGLVRIGLGDVFKLDHGHQYMANKHRKNWKIRILRVHIAAAVADRSSATTVVSALAIYWSTSEKHRERFNSDSD